MAHTERFLDARAVTSGPRHHFFGYYDKQQWDATGHGRGPFDFAQDKRDTRGTAFPGGHVWPGCLHDNAGPKHHSPLGSLSVMRAQGLCSEEGNAAHRAISATTARTFSPTGTSAFSGLFGRRRE